MFLCVRVCIRVGVIIDVFSGRTHLDKIMYACSASQTFVEFEYTDCLGFF